MNDPKLQREKSGQSLWYDAYRRLKRDKLAVVCFFIILTYFLTAALVQFGLLYAEVTSSDLAYGPPSTAHWFGTDIFGRDVWAKAVQGIRTAVLIGFVASFISIPLGVFFGALAGYFGGIVDDLVVWFYTTLDSIPYILLIIALAYVLGSGLTNAIIAIGVTSWVPLCRVIRGEFLKNKEREFVLAAQALGASHSRRAFRHILPNTFHVILIRFSLSFVFAIKSEVILSYLGLGVEPGKFSWGLMIDDAKMELSRGVWWQLAAATILMFVLILAFNLFNDALREALDPKLKNK
jgi:ABC-type dipeptide/oligopeptide/nickel transport system permease subunit